MDRQFSGIINENTIAIVDSGCFKVQDKKRKGERTLKKFDVCGIFC